MCFSSGPFPDSAWHVWFSITRPYLGSVGHTQLHCNTVTWERLFIAKCWGAPPVLLDSSCDSHDSVWVPKRDETALVIGHTWASVCHLHHHHLQLHIGGPFNVNCTQTVCIQCELTMKSFATFQGHTCVSAALDGPCASFRVYLWRFVFGS